MLLSNKNYYFVYLGQWLCILCFEWSMLVLGPCLIATVITLVGCETYWALTVLVPRATPLWSTRWWAHAMWIIFLAFNGLFNYLSCVFTNPGTHVSHVYRVLVFEASESDGEYGFYCPDTAAIEMGVSGINILRKPQIVASRNSTSSWLDRGPYDWYYCKRSHSPKAPRSHYDHVTRKLILNMDHYCPWMFNCVGFANYRHFILFLFYVTVACTYGVVLTLADFVVVAGSRIPHTIRGVRITNQTRTAVMFTFVLALSIGIAVLILFGWHVYLVLTAQTTIEFYGNHTLRLRARAGGVRFQNPYDRGYSKNWQGTFDGSNLLVATLPSLHPPPGRPWPKPRRCQTLSIV